MYGLTTISLLTAVASAQYSGVATFNHFSTQPVTVCNSEHSGPSGTYVAAIGDLSPNIWNGATCSGSINYGECNGQSGAVSGYTGPSCPQTNCNECFQVCNAGGFSGAAVGGVGNCITVYSVDVCPSESADNYCKQEVPAAERCGADVNALDIDVSAYEPLTGQAFGSGPNLMVNITPVTCP